MTDATEDPKTFSDVEGTFAEEGLKSLEEKSKDPTKEPQQVRYPNRHERRRAAKLAQLQAKEEAREKKVREGSNV